MQQVFKLKTANRTIIASANHPFLKYHPRGKHYWSRLDQLKEGDRIMVVNCIEGGVPLNLPQLGARLNRVHIPRATTNEFMELIGHFVGDGFIKRVRARTRLAELRICEPVGSKFHEKYASLYNKIFGARTFLDNEGGKLAISSAAIAELFVALDLDHPAGQKDVPDWVFSLPLDQRFSFLKGYGEADANIRHREATKLLADPYGRQRLVCIIQDTVGVASTNENLVRRLHELCMISGIRATNVRSRRRAGNKLESGRFIPPSVQFEFQFSLKQDRRAFKIARIRAIEPLGERETYDLQVDEYQNFVAESIIVHNTGDASLTLAQTVPLGGVVIVTTPQEASLNIATKALAMFKKLNVPILGIVENMSYFVCPHCGERTYIFAEGGGRRAAKALDVQFLGEIPIYPLIREQSDIGKPVVASAPHSPESAVFKDIAYKVAGMVSIVAYENSQSQ
jgi:hypothetical protein